MKDGNQMKVSWNVDQMSMEFYEAIPIDPKLDIDSIKKQTFDSS